MSYAGMTRGDFFSRTSLIHLYDGSSTPNTANKYINFNKYDVRKLIDEQVKLGARSFLWIVCGTMTLPDDETVLVEGEYRGEDGNFVPLFSTTATGGGHFIEKNVTASGLVPLSHWRLERESIEDLDTFFIRLKATFSVSAADVHIHDHLVLSSLAIFGGFYEEPYREYL